MPKVFASNYSSTACVTLYLNLLYIHRSLLSTFITSRWNHLLPTFKDSKVQTSHIHWKCGFNEIKDSNKDSHVMPISKVADLECDPPYFTKLTPLRCTSSMQPENQSNSRSQRIMKQVSPPFIFWRVICWYDIPAEYPHKWICTDEELQDVSQEEIEGMTKNRHQFL